jgi:hypothetical protein
MYHHPGSNFDIFGQILSKIFAFSEAENRLKIINKILGRKYRRHDALKNLFFDPK